MRRRNEELAQAYRDKSRKLLQTQELYDKAKRKAEMGHIQRAASDAVDSTLLAESQSQRTAAAFDGYQPQQEQGYRDAFAPYAHGNKLDAPGAYSSYFKSSFRHIPTDERWPGSGQGRATDCESERVHLLVPSACGLNCGPSDRLLRFRRA